MSLINILLDLEKDLRLCEEALASGHRYLNCVKDDDWFNLMDDYGFLAGNKFLPIIEIIKEANKLSEERRIFALEAVACDLSKIKLL